MTTTEDRVNPYPAFRDLSPAGQAAAEWFRQLGRALETCRLHHPDDSIVPELRTRLFEQLNTMLQGFGPMVLRFTASEIFLADEPVVRPSRRTREDARVGFEEQLPFLFHRDGIRTLWVRTEVPSEDFDALFGALLTCSAGPRTDDDLVTLLWQANPLRIQIETVPLLQTLDGFSRGADGDRREGSQDETAARPSSAPVVPAATESPGGARPSLRDTFDDWGLPGATVEVPTAYAEMMRWMEFVRTTFVTAWASERAVHWTDDAPLVLRRILALDPTEDTRALLARAAVTWLAEAVQRTAWVEARSAFELIRELDPDGSIADAELGTILSGLDTELITGRLDEAKSEDQALFFALAVAIGRPALDLVCAVMARAQKSHTRASACSTLCYLCDDRPELLAPCLGDSRWYVVRNAVFVLGQIGSPRVLDLLRSVAFHAEPRVRRQVVQSLGGVTPADRLPILLGQLDTRDPQLLAASLSMLLREKSPELAPAIVRRILAPDFETRSEDNQRALFNALAETATDEAVPGLEALLHRGGWLARPTFQRLASAHTLRRLGTPRALEALEAGLNSRSEAVRSACLEAVNAEGIA